MSPCSHANAVAFRLFDRIAVLKAKHMQAQFEGGLALWFAP